MKKVLLACVFSLSLWAAPVSNVYSVTYKGSMDTIEKNLLTHFKASKLVVPWKLDILEELA